MRIGLADLDVFAYIDADSAEAKAFTTYLGYVRAFDDLMTNASGILDFAHIRKQMDPAGLHRLRSRPYRSNAQVVSSLLINAWLHELHLHLVDSDNVGIVRVANHAAAVYAYYATSRAASAWHFALTSTAPQTHAGLLLAIDRLIATAPSMYPCPWSLSCTRLFPSPVYQGFLAPPQPCSNLSRVAPPIGLAAKCLKTTRQKQVTQLIEETKLQRKIARAPSGERERKDGGLHRTTIFDFLWRSRARSNYGDPAMFYMGAIVDDDVAGYLSGLRNITAGTSFIFETFLAHRAPDVLTEAATHFISRDRSGLTDVVLVPRLAELGIVARPRRRRR